MNSYDIDVFVSYHTSSSQGVVETVVAKLESIGIKCWYAPRDIEGGYAGSIIRAINSCKVFLLILNKQASESSRVLNELENAHKRFAAKEMAIVPFRIADSEFSDDATYYLSRIHWSDGVTEPFSDRVNELAERIASLLEIETSGRVKITLPDGSIYEGEQENGVRTGKGSVIWPNGDEYVGDFKNGLRHGKGRFTWTSGNVYEGDYFEGKRHGRGKFIWASGDIYEGDYLYGERTGNGKLTYANGDVYVGRFETGTLTDGFVTSSDGSIKKIEK